ncbi:MAG: hypothetical protein MZV64_21665 [Ignavibacteriales bacterium]|nr:hypothetical protein [Ignavibacteriales bacterium]
MTCWQGGILRVGGQKVNCSIVDSNTWTLDSLATGFIQKAAVMTVGVLHKGTVAMTASSEH